MKIVPFFLTFVFIGFGIFFHESLFFFVYDYGATIVTAISSTLFFCFDFIKKHLFFIGSIILLIYGYFGWRNTKSFVKRKEIEKCPICLESKIKGITLINCKHSICYECFESYLKHNLKDLTKYPLKCPSHECINELCLDSLKLVLNNEDMKVYKRFQTIKTVPRQLRIHCPSPDCNQIMLRDSKYISDHINKFKQEFHYLCRNVSNHSNNHFYPSYHSNKPYTKHFVSKNNPNIIKCTNDICNHQFGIILGYWKRHCYACGKLYCGDCVRYSMNIPEFDYSNYYNINEIPLCMYCFTKIFCIECKSDNKECKQWICLRCEKPWHDVANDKYYKLKDYENDNSMCKIKKEQDRISSWQYNPENGDTSLLKDKETMNLIENEGYTPCPQCGTMIEKSSGCNHMTHKNCTNGTENGNDTHFCYTCGELLYGMYHNEEKSGRKHFPDGIFSPCYKAPKNKSNVGCLVM